MYSLLISMYNVHWYSRSSGWKLAVARVYHSAGVTTTRSLAVYHPRAVDRRGTVPVAAHLCRSMAYEADENPARIRCTL